MFLGTPQNPINTQIFWTVLPVPQNIQMHKTCECLIQIHIPKDLKPYLHQPINHLLL